MSTDKTRNFCPQECLGQKSYPSPVVEDTELVCRGAYKPMHYNKSGKLKRSFIERRMLAAGELSVWRCKAVEDVEPLARKLIANHDTASRKLDEILAVECSAIRTAIDPETTLRMFSVINDTRIDDINNDEDHAALSPCKRYIVDGTIQESSMVQLINVLELLYRPSQVWKRAA